MTGPSVETTPVPDGWARTVPDSSVLRMSQAFTKVTVPLADVERVATLYGTLLGAEPQARMPMPDAGLLVVSMDGLVVTTALSDGASDADVTRVILVPGLDELPPRLERAGFTVLDEPIDVPPGRLMHTRDPDGSISEWIEYRPLPGERPATPLFQELPEHLR